MRVNVEVIVATSTSWIHAAQEATRSIPIVMTATADPIASGFVKSLARPGGNITGLTIRGIAPLKRLELLREVNPKLSRIAYLFNPDNPANVGAVKASQDAASKLGLRFFSVWRSHREADRGSVWKHGPRIGRGADHIAGAAIYPHRRQIAALAIKHRLPSIGVAQEMAEAGLLMTDGKNLPDLYRRAAIYVDKILKGAKPADLPVEQPTRFDFVVNLKTAKALGIKLPSEITVRAEWFVERATKISLIAFDVERQQEKTCYDEVAFARALRLKSTAPIADTRLKRPDARFLEIF